MVESERLKRVMYYHVVGMMKDIKILKQTITEYALAVRYIG